MHMESIGSAPPFPADPESPEANGMTSRRDSASDQSNTAPLQARMAGLVADNIELRAEIEQLKADRRRIADIQTRLMEVLNCKSPDKLVHDVRNVLNERELYRALADTVM